ncbi:hypothetical protein [Hafnia phage TS33]|nr:hypothetical protein [Hafnia phage TS33]
MNTIELPAELVSQLLNLLVTLDSVAEELPPEVIAAMSAINKGAMH